MVLTNLSHISTAVYCIFMSLSVAHCTHLTTGICHVLVIDPIRPLLTRSDQRRRQYGYGTAIHHRSAVLAFAEPRYCSCISLAKKGWILSFTLPYLRNQLFHLLNTLSIFGL